MTRVAAPELAGGGSGAPAEGGGGAPVQGGARREARGGAARGDRATQAAIGRLDQGPSLRARALPRQGQRAQGRRRGTYVSGTSNFVTTAVMSVAHRNIRICAAVYLAIAYCEAQFYPQSACNLGPLISVIQL